MGIYVAVRELAIAQQQAGGDVHLLVDGVWPEDGVRAAGVQVHTVSGFGAARRMLRTLAVAGGVLHSHMVWSPISLLPLLAGRPPGMRAVVSTHGCLAPEAMRTKRFKKVAGWHVLFRRATRAHDAIVATFEEEREQIAAYRLGRPILIVPNTVSPPPPQTVVKQRTVGFIGRLHPIKGVLELVQAWTQVAAAFPDWRLRLVGPPEDADYAAKLRELAARTPSITVEPPVFGAGKWQFLAECELVAVPSHSENFCYVVAEAYLAGTPVLTTTGVPWPELEPLQLGWRGAGDAAALAQQLRRALSATDADRRTMGARGRDFVDARFSHAAVARTSFAAYESLFA